jgi:kynureninase
MHTARKVLLRRVLRLPKISIQDVVGARNRGVIVPKLRAAHRKTGSAPMNITQADCEALDRADPLRAFREEFVLPEGLAYLDGNSLGALPLAAAARVAAVVEQEWGKGLIGSWNDAGWIDLPEQIGAKLAGLLGAAPGTVIAADSTSVNTFKLLAVALGLQPDRRVILAETGGFPTDNYIAEGFVRLTGDSHVLRLVNADEIRVALGSDVAVLMLTHVNYRTGAMHDMAALTAAAHEAGVLVLWDLAHSAGAVPVNLERAGADLAVGCGYKFLNGGPGAPAFLYVAKRLQEAARYPLTGWLGHVDPFGFHPGYQPAAGIKRAAVGTPSIIAMAVLEVGIDIAVRAPMPAVRAKSLRQSALLMELIAQQCGNSGLELAAPIREDQRGSQVSFRHPEAYAVMQALIARGVIGDFRPPDIIRFGITPLYLRYLDLWNAVSVLGDVLLTEAWKDERFRVRKVVT